MSQEDEIRWDKRYRAGSYRARSYASPLLERWIDTLALCPGARVLDLGCGSGRNSLYLAERGLAVTGVDISSIAIAQAENKAEARGLTVSFRQRDLDLPIVETDLAQSKFQLIIMIRYINRRLFPHISSLLSPNGYFVAEHHVVTQQSVSGPMPTDSDQFRYRPNELRSAMTNLHVLHYDEAISCDRDDRRVALAQLVATTRPAPA